MMLPFYKAAVALEDKFAPKPSTITRTEKSVLKAMQAKGFRLADDYHDSEIMGEVRELVSSAGLKKMPKIILYSNPAPNAAMVYDSTMFISDSALRIFNKQERVGVIAHELGHAKQHPLNLVAQLSGLAFIFLAARKVGNLAVEGAKKIPNPLKAPVNGERSKIFQNTDTLTMTIVFDIALAAIGVAVVMAQSAFRRHQEHDADKTSAKLTGNPKALVSSLKKLEKEYAKIIEPTIIPPTDKDKKELKEETRIISQRESRQVLTPKRPGKLLRSHPSTDDREQRLNQMPQRVPYEDDSPKQVEHATKVIDMREAQEKLKLRKQRA